jgi:hypothetical protein
MFVMDVVVINIVRASLSARLALADRADRALFVI